MKTKALVTAAVILVVLFLAVCLLLDASRRIPEGDAKASVKSRFGRPCSITSSGTTVRKGRATSLSTTWRYWAGTRTRVPGTFRRA